MRIEGPHPSSIAHFGILVANLSSGGAMRLPSSPVVVEFPLPGERREGPARSPPLLVLNGAGGLGDTWSGLVTPPSRGGDDGQGRRPGLVEWEKVGSVTRSGVVTAIDGWLITVAGTPALSR